MNRVFTTGTFDVLHYGHINLLKRASKYGQVTVGLNVTKNGKPTYYSYKDRKAMLEAIKYVNKVVPIKEQKDKFNYLKKCDLFIIGDDYKGYNDIPEIQKYCKVIFLRRTPKVCSTDTQKHLSDKTKYNRIVVDLDDTLCFTQNRDFENSEPIKNVINKVNSLYKKGYEIYICTARGEKSCKTLEEKEQKYRNITEKWLKKNNVKYTKLMFGKPNADYYVDDKNLTIEDFLCGMWLCVVETMNFQNHLLK